ncbi:MAG: FAD-binding oxidoreductase [Methanobacteriota archaeon]|nr:MAG: FAD-binding oxidoreductase [Euryarchaeota archaeon]
MRSSNLDIRLGVEGTMPASEIPRRAEVVIVGGGCMGASIAFHLARRGVGAILVERDHIGAGATGHSGAIVRQFYESRVGIRLARKSLAFFRRFQGETGVPCDFRRTGFLTGSRLRDLPAFDALVGLLRTEGVRLERLRPKEAAGMEPQLDVSDYEAMVHDPDAGYADPIATAAGFAQAACRDGAKAIEGEEVREVIIRRGRVAGERLRGRDVISSERVVLAAGNWTPWIARQAGVRLPVHFVRGDVAILRRPPGSGAPPRIHFDVYGNTYSRPEGEKDVLVGYMDSGPQAALRGPELLDNALPVATGRDLLSRLARRFPIMARAQPRGGWSGLYDVTPDAYPILDAVGPTGLFVAVGFSGHGFKLCPEVGRLLGEFIASDRKPDELAPLRAHRYREREPVVPESPFPALRGRTLP